MCVRDVLPLCPPPGKGHSSRQLPLMEGLFSLRIFSWLMTNSEPARAQKTAAIPPHAKSCLPFLERAFRPRGFLFSSNQQGERD